jgi:hypothetical protein
LYLHFSCVSNVFVSTMKMVVVSPTFVWNFSINGFLSSHFWIVEAFQSHIGQISWWKVMGLNFCLTQLVKQVLQSLIESTLVSWCSKQLPHWYLSN